VRAKLRSRVTFSNVASLIALFIALSSGAYAAVKLKSNSVKSRHIAPEAVKGVDASEATFGKVPSAQSADTAGSANTAASANTAGSANTANTANTAENATLLDGQPASDYLPANELHNSGRVVVDDPVPGDASPIQAPPLVANQNIAVGFFCWENISATTSEQASVLVSAQDGAPLSVSTVRSDGTSENQVASQVFVINGLNSAGNVIRSAYFTAVHPDGDVVTGSVSAELNDAAPGSSDCTFGGTAIGPRLP
jgi:hypothetical protein